MDYEQKNHLITIDSELELILLIMLHRHYLINFYPKSKRMSNQWLDCWYTYEKHQQMVQLYELSVNGASHVLVLE